MESRGLMGWPGGGWMAGRTHKAGWASSSLAFHVSDPAAEPRTWSRRLAPRRYLFCFANLMAETTSHFLPLTKCDNGFVVSSLARPVLQTVGRQPRKTWTGLGRNSVGPGTNQADNFARGAWHRPERKPCWGKLGVSSAQKLILPFGFMPTL